MSPKNPSVKLQKSNKKVLSVKINLPPDICRGEGGGAPVKKHPASVHIVCILQVLSIIQVVGIVSLDQIVVLSAGWLRFQNLVNVVKRC